MHRPVPWRHATGASIASLAAIGFITVFAPAAHNPLYRWAEVPITVLATVVLIHTGYGNPEGVVTRVVSRPWLTGIGRASYSLYLWHLVPVLLLEHVDLGLPKPVLGLISVAATVVLTMTSYQLLEKPFLRARGEVLRPSRPVPARERSG